MENMIYLKNVVTLNLNEEKCIGCGMCIEVCPHAVIGMNGAGRAWIRKRDTSMECGAGATLPVVVRLIRVNSQRARGKPPAADRNCHHISDQI